MGFTTEHRDRGPKVCVPGTGQFPNSTCIRTNQSSEGIRYTAVVLSSQKKFVDNVAVIIIIMKAFIMRRVSG